MCQKTMPPFLHIHGTADKLVPYPQSVDFDKELRGAGVTSTLITVDAGGHGNFGRANEAIQKLVAGFLGKNLREAKGFEEKPQTLKAGGD